MFKISPKEGMHELCQMAVRSWGDLCLSSLGKNLSSQRYGFNFTKVPGWG